MINGSNNGRPLVVVDNGSLDTVARARKEKKNLNSLIDATIYSFATLQYLALSMVY